MFTVHIVNERFHMSRSFKQNKNVIYMPFINRDMVKHELWITSFFSIGVFFHDHSRITGLKGNGEGISLTPHYYFHPLHRHLDISQAITAESSPLHIGNSRTQTENLWFPSASR